MNNVTRALLETISARAALVSLAAESHLRDRTRFDVDNEGYELVGSPPEWGVLVDMAGELSRAATALKVHGAKPAE